MKPAHRNRNRKENRMLMICRNWNVKWRVSFVKELNQRQVKRSVLLCTSLIYWKFKTTRINIWIIFIYCLTLSTVAVALKRFGFTEFCTDRLLFYIKLVYWSLPSKKRVHLIVLLSKVPRNECVYKCHRYITDNIFICKCKQKQKWSS